VLSFHCKPLSLLFLACLHSTECGNAAAARIHPLQTERLIITQLRNRLCQSGVTDYEHRCSTLTLRYVMGGGKYAGKWSKENAKKEKANVI
jgi:hypothetical protein